ERIRNHAADVGPLGAAFGHREVVDALATRDIQNLDVFERVGEVEPLLVLREDHRARRTALRRPGGRDLDRAGDLLGRFVDDEDAVRPTADVERAVAGGELWRRWRALSGADA